MDENKYQLGIRKLKHERLVDLVIAYRNALKECVELNNAFATQDFAQDPLHRIVCAIKNKRLNKLITDYVYALRENICD